ncbi:hypothetical protein M422DRAFT_277084 [Sphaerobolus stellatus SS14]|uniref:Uncharacterized protein n=1 Tax=Sphaerobolus stellatus (strain SS14) TaxID=990650 RepID=A0A0C9TKV8_SPHS4|nr:hypothetical protein M422DRAFT_277084 [Sphaerobolus stellatus SS14]
MKSTVLGGRDLEHCQVCRVTVESKARASSLKKAFLSATSDPLSRPPTQHIAAYIEAVRGRLQISARNLSVRNHPSRQAPSGSDSARDSPSTHSSTPVAGEREVWLETVVVWWRVYAHVVIAYE